MRIRARVDPAEVSAGVGRQHAARIARDETFKHTLRLIDPAGGQCGRGFVEEVARRVGAHSLR